MRTRMRFTYVISVYQNAIEPEREVLPCRDIAPEESVQMVLIASPFEAVFAALLTQFNIVAARCVAF